MTTRRHAASSPQPCSILLLIVLLSFAFRQVTLSQAVIWEPTAGIPGGAITTLLVDSVGTIYAGTYNRGVYRSSNSGASWQSSNTGLGGGFVYDFGLDRNNNMLVATDYGLYRSSDHGEHWQSVYQFFNPYSVATNSSGHLFVGCEQDWNVGDFYRSTDDGVTWVRFQIPNYLTAWDLIIARGDTIFAATGRGVYRSTNNAVTWDSVNTGLTSRVVWCLAVNASNHLFAGTQNGGAFRTTDGGTTWHQRGLLGENVVSLSFSNDGYLFAATQHGVFRSTDNGTVWAPMNNGLTNTNTDFVATSRDGSVYVGTFGSAVFRSTDNGMSWYQASNGISNSGVGHLAADNTGRLYAAPGLGGGVVVSTNEGISWENAGLQGGSLGLLAVRSEDILYAVSSSGAYRTTNRGGIWSFSTVWQSGSPSPSGISINSLGHVFIARDSSVYRSTDEGTSWTRKVLGSSGWEFVDDVIANARDNLFAIVSSLVYRSTNNGDTWALASTGITSPFVYTLGTNINSDVYAIGDSIFRTTNDGETWLLATDGVNGVFIPHPFARNAVGHIFVGKGQGLVFRSTNNGVQWTSFNTGLSGGYITCLSVTNSGRLFAGTTAGVFRTIFPTTNAFSDRVPRPTTFELLQNYPNPFNASTMISYTVAQAGPVSLVVYDLLGREVTTLVSSTQAIGTHVVDFGSANLPSGVYFYKLSSSATTLIKKMLLLK